MSKKELGFFDLFCISSGAMISSGLFVLPGLAYAKMGPSCFLAYIIASFLVIPAMLSKAELATAMPKSGGTYFFIDRSMGSGFGTLAGLSSWFSLSFKSAFALLGIGAFAVLIFPDLSELQIKLIAGGSCLFFGVLNLFSAKHAGRMQILLVSGLIVLLILYVGIGLPEMKVTNLTPFWKGDFRTAMATAGLIFISYGGLTKVASVAGEAKDPTRSIPLSMIVSYVIVSAIYGLAVMVTVGLLGEGLIINGNPSLTPLADGAMVSMGLIGKILLASAAILAFVSTGNAGILTASRVPLAMSEDKLLPKFFTKGMEKKGVPQVAVIITTTFMLVVILFLELEMLVKTASTMMIMLFISENVAVILMRESKILNYKPKFKTPGYPWIQGFGIVAYIFLLFEMGAGPLIITFSFMAAALFWYWIYGRINSNRVSAVAHLVRRLTAKEMRYDILNSELREILLERDEIVEDRFDQLVKAAAVIDTEADSFEEVFEEIAAELAERTEMDADTAYKLLLEREDESSTVLTPGMAVPHVIIPGKHQFELTLVRSRKGVKFAENETPVEALFVLAGTADERNFHLKALMSIAQIVQQSKFMDKWRTANQEDGLRDFILLSERTREV